MSSDVADFLFSFACNKLETCPHLDLRQQLLHSNLIRHILLAHQSNSNFNSSSSDSSSHSNIHESDPSPSNSSSLPSSSPSEDLPHLLSLPPLPPSPPLPPTSPPSSAQVPQSLSLSHHHHHQLHSSPFLYPSDFHPHPDFHPFPLQSLAAHCSDLLHWCPFSFDDERDRIDLPDQDVVMAEEDGSDPDMAHLELSTPYLQHIHNNNSNSYDCTVGFHPHYSGAHLPVADFDLDYDFESTQAQEDWLDAVLEDLMEEDEQEESGPEYNSEDEIDSFADNSDLHDIETLKRKGQEKVAALVAYQINFQPSRPLYA